MVSEISGTSQRESQKIHSFFFLSFVLFDFQFDSQPTESNRKLTLPPYLGKRTNDF